MNTKKKVLKLSLYAAVIVCTSMFAADDDNTTSSSLGTVDVVAESQKKESYTVESMNTSTKLNLSIKDTPQSVSVITAQKIQDMGVTSYQQLLSKIPGVTLNKWDERVYPTARGFKIDYLLYDGVPTYSIADNGANDTDLSIYERVEVVKGSNGLMTGAGNPALGLNYIRKHADSKEETGTLDISTGSWNNNSMTADISSPINSDGSIRARVVAKHQDQESYMDNYEKSTDVVYGVVDMDLTDTTYLSLGASVEDIKRDGIRWGGLPAFYSDGTRTNFDRSKTVSGDWTYWNVETKSYYADLQQYLFDNVSLNLSLTHRELSSETALAYLYGTVDKDTNIGEGGVYGYVSEAEQEEDNINLYATIPFNTGSLEHEVVTGVSKNTYDFKYNNYEGTGYLTSSVSNPLIDFDDINVANPNLSASYETATRPSTTTQTGTYIAGRFSLLEQLKLISGLRVSTWEYESANGDGDRKFDNEYTPYVGLVFNINKNYSVYSSYTSIFKPQDLKDANDNYLDPIEGNSYEVGIKGEYFDGALNTSLTLFKTYQDGVGEDTGLVNTTTYESIYEAKDGVTSKGYEVSLSGNATDNLSIDFGLAHFEAKDKDGVKVNTDSSRTTANIFAKYDINLFRIGGGVDYKSKQYVDSSLFSSQTITQEGYYIVSLMGGYKLRKNLDLQININNLLDKEYYEGIGDNSMVYGDPRNYTANLKYTF